MMDQGQIDDQEAVHDQSAVSDRECVTDQSISSSDGISSSDDDESSEGDSAMDQAERDWEESLGQVQMLLTFVLVPVIGRLIGRRFAFYSMKPVKPNFARIKAQDHESAMNLVESLGRLSFDRLF